MPELPTEAVPMLVSVDDHIVEPPRLWADRLSGHDREVGPRVVRELIQPGTMADVTEPTWCDVWHYEDVRVPTLRAPAAVGMDPSLAELKPTIFEEMRPGCYEREARLADMDLDGVEASLCFPNVWVRFCGQRFYEGQDKDLALKCVRAYNDWLHEEWAGPSEGRLIGAAIIPLWDAELAAAEVRRNAARGFRAVSFSEIPVRLGLPSMYSGAWEPFFTACAETSTVINVHIGSSSLVHTTSPDAPFGVQTSNHFSNSSFSLSDWLLCGAFIRHPNLKVAFSEGQAGWMPFLLSRLDGLWRTANAFTEIREAVPELPSSYVPDHVYTCVFDDPAAMKLLDEIGVDNICFETDYPHGDGSWPGSRRAAAELTKGLDAATRQKILRTNAAVLFGIDRVLREPSLATTP
ncbi:MAG: hypothetical protein JWO68_176 [Actinomycetia bacterium]|nr:hypothetical protein [Actinomycetes bacterium]